jgi:hypothetical protein
MRSRCCSYSFACVVHKCLHTRFPNARCRLPVGNYSSAATLSAPSSTFSGSRRTRQPSMQRCAAEPGAKLMGAPAGLWTQGATMSVQS